LIVIQARIKARVPAGSKWRASTQEVVATTHTQAVTYWSVQPKRSTDAARYPFLMG